MTEQIQAIAELIANIPGATVEISEGTIKISGVDSLSSKQKISPGKKRQAKKLPKVLSDEQIEKLISALNKDYPTGSGRRNITNLRNRVMFETMLRAGLRVSEVCNLAPADVNLVRGSIYVQLGKGSKDRKVVIGPTLISWLEKWAEVRPESEYFFSTAKGTRVAPRHLNAVLHRLSEETGVTIRDGREDKSVHNHLFRHTYATNLLDNGVNIRAVQELLGHSSLSTTQKYTHVNMSNLDAQIKALG